VRGQVCPTGVHCAKSCDVQSLNSTAVPPPPLIPSSDSHPGTARLLFLPLVLPSPPGMHREETFGIPPSVREPPHP